jgi:hypothetical protein
MKIRSRKWKRKRIGREKEALSPSNEETIRRHG